MKMDEIKKMLIINNNPLPLKNVYATDRNNRIQKNDVSYFLNLN